MSTTDDDLFYDAGDQPSEDLSDGFVLPEQGEPEDAAEGYQGIQPDQPLTDLPAFDPDADSTPDFDYQPLKDPAPGFDPLDSADLPEFTSQLDENFGAPFEPQPSPKPDAEFDFDPPEDLLPDFDHSRMEEDLAAFHRELNSLQTPAVLHPLEDSSASEPGPAPRRRRRTFNLTDVLNAGDLGERLQSISQRAAPSIDFFVLSLICGLIIAIGYLLDAPAILIIGICTAPLLGPLVGIGLSAVTGETSLFRLTLSGLFISVLLVFILGALTGLVTRLMGPLSFTQAFYHSQLWWPDLLLLVVGCSVLVVSFIQNDEKPVIASLMTSYEIYLPASVAGFGLGSGIHGLWPQALVVLLIHISLALIISLVIFFFMGFRPLERSAYALSAGIVVIGAVIMAGFASFGSMINVRGDQAYATAMAAPTATPVTPSPLPPSATAVPVIIPPTNPPTATLTLTPSLTPPPPPPTSTGPVFTPTLPGTASTNASNLPTLVPTPVYGRVQSPSSDGVLIRIRPGGPTITTVQNGYLAQIKSDKPVVLDGLTWIHVIITTPKGDIDGWVISSLIVTATPSFSP